MWMARRTIFLTIIFPISAPNSTPTMPLAQRGPLAKIDGRLAKGIVSKVLPLPAWA